jgi:uncharacterized membrane protein YgcG
MRRLLVLLPMLMFGIHWIGASALADGISLDFQRAHVIKLAKPASSVIVGDPFVADVTLENPTTLILFGKEPGETNLIVLDHDKGLLFDWPVVVRDATDNRVSVFTPGQPGEARNVYEGIWLCTDQNRCLRVPGASDISPFKYNVTNASHNDSVSSGSGGQGSNGQSGGSGAGGETSGGGEAPGDGSGTSGGNGPEAPLPPAE